MATSEKTAKKKNSRSALLMIAGLIVIFATPTAVFVLGGLVPTYASWLMDREKGKLTTITVGALNVAALTPLLLQLWSNNSLDYAAKLLFSPFSWILMLAGAGIGWVLAQVVPAVVVMMISTRNKTKLQNIRARQKQLVEEWGNSIIEGN